MFHYRAEQNHRWVQNLSAAKAYFTKGEMNKFFQGDLTAKFQYPGMKIMGAFWVAENMEMKERLAIHTDVLKLKDEAAFKENSNKYYQWFLADFEQLSKEKGLFSEGVIRDLFGLAKDNLLTEFDWQEKILALQERSTNEETTPELLSEWFYFCGRFILSYAKNLIQQAVRSALYVKENSQKALTKAIKPTIEYFSWKINRIFFNDAMPKTGFEDLGDVVSLGSYGMLSDQAVGVASEKIIGEVTQKRSLLTTCQLFGFFDSVATDMGLPKGATSDAYCPFCVGHGRTTMHFVLPPDRKVKYSLESGLGYGGKQCVFLLETTPGEDDARTEEATAKIFGDVPLSY